MRHENKVNEFRILNFKKEEQVKTELNALEAEKIDELELLQENLRFGAFRNRFLERPNSIEEEIGLRKRTGKK